MNNKPIHAEPLSDQKKEDVFFSQVDSPDVLLQNYVDAFVAQNDLGKAVTVSMIRRRILFSLVYALILFLLIVYRCLYHSSVITFILVAGIVTLVYVLLMRSMRVKKYLFKEVKKRPQDNIDNILASQVSGLRRGESSIIASVGIILATLLGCAFLFATPHFIYERNSFGYSVRYYSLAIISEDTVVVPNSHKGLPVNEIRGSTFLNMRFSRVILPDSITQIRGNTFEGCQKLRSIVIPEGVTRIGGSAFEGCSSLETVELPASLEEIGGSAFRRCGSLNDISLEKTSLVRIGTSAFRNCGSLKTVSLPATLTSLGDSVFRDCPRLETVSLPARASMGQKVFLGTPAQVNKY